MSRLRFSLFILVAAAAALDSCRNAADGETRTSASVSGPRSSNLWHFADFPEPTKLSKVSMPTFTLVERQRYGSMDGLGALDVVSQVAVTDSFVVALQWRSCEFVVFARSSGRARRRFGQCGRGPDDYWDMSQGSLTTLGDTLVIVDKYGRRLRMVSTDGKVYRTSVIDSTLLSTPARISRLYMLGESSALLSMNLPPHRRQGPTVVAAMPTAPFLRRVSLATAVVEDSAFREGPAIAANVTNTMRTPIECTLGTTSKDVEIAVLNRWEPQFVVVPLESLNRPRLNVLLPASIATHPERPDSAGKFAAMGLAEIACGDSVAVASRRPANATNAAPELAEIYAYSRASGTVAYARFDEKNGAALGRLAAARRSRFFMVHNARYDYPVITELEYVANGPARVSSTDFRSSR